MKKYFRTDQYTSYQATKRSPTHDIFAELLGEHSSGDQEQATPFNNVHKCSDDHVVYWESGLQDAVISPHHIITCSSNDSNNRLAVYPWIKGKSGGNREIASSFLYQILLPRDTCNNKVLTMLYVTCAGSTLDQQLFSSLVCSKPRINCPIVLVGFQSGLVGYMYVGVMECNPQNTNLETLYHLEQPVLSIIPVCLKSTKNVNPSATPTCNALCILGTLGKLVLITHNSTETLRDTIVFREFHVPGPIACATISNNLSTLFCSTLKDVYTVPLQIDEDSPSLLFPFTLSPKTFHIPKVLALTIDEQNSLNCLTTDGRVLLVAQSSEDILPAPSQQSGDEIKKHLDEIHEKASQVKNLRDEIHQLDEVIKALNTVTQVFCEVLRNRESQDDASFRESGIFFKVGVGYEAQGTSLNPRVILRCDLINSTKFPFSPNWSLVVQVSTSEPWFNEECCVQETVNHSVSLSPAPSHHISIPMKEIFSYLTPVQVSCYLSFGLNELLPIFLKETEPALSEEGFSVLVSRTELNILNFLRKPDTCSSVSYERRHPARLLRDTLRSINTSGPPEPVHSVGFSSFSTQLSGEAVNFIQAHVQGAASRNDTKFSSKPLPANPGPNQDYSSQEACVLGFILHASSRHVYCDELKYLENYVVARTPNEEVVKFQVVGQTGTSQDTKGLEVRVHTSSQELGCSLHTSLLKVFKVGLNILF